GTRPGMTVDTEKPPRVSGRSLTRGVRRYAALQRPHHGGVAHAVRRGETLHRFVDHAPPRARCVARQKLAATLSERDEAGVRIIEIGAPRDEADDIASLKPARIRQQRRLRNDVERPLPGPEGSFGIRSFL